MRIHSPCCRIPDVDGLAAVADAGAEGEGVVPPCVGVLIPGLVQVIAHRRTICTHTHNKWFTMRIRVIFFSVSDPDGVFFWIRIRNPDPDPGA